MPGIGDAVVDRYLGHSLDIDAHHSFVMQLIRTGNYFYPLPAYTVSYAQLTADTIYASPFMVARDLTIDRLGIQVHTVDAGKIARLGIYNNGTNLYPGTLVVDAGTVSVNDVAVVAATISEALTKGLYWLIVVSDGAPTLYTLTSNWTPLGTYAAQFGNAYMYKGWSKASVGSAALADPFVTGASLGYANIMNVLPRLESLD